MDPGDTVDVGMVKSIVCLVLNDLSTPALLPAIVIEGIKKNSGVLRPAWPLGVYIIFTVEGISVGIYGHNAEGALVNGVSSLDLEEDKVPHIGEAMWQMWKRLRDTNEDELAANFNRLLKQTEERILKLS